MRIFGDKISGNCHKVKWVMNHLDFDHDWVEIDILAGESRTAEFLAMNPAGQVPVLMLEDGRAISQSNAIILYLAEGSDLIPEDWYDRARMMEWLFWEQYSHEPYVAVTRFQTVYKQIPFDDLDATLLAKANGALDHLESALKDSEFLIGSKLSLADIALAAYTRLAPDGGFSLDTRPAIRAWIKRIETQLAITP